MFPKPVFDPTVRPLVSSRRLGRQPSLSEVGWQSRDDGSDETVTTFVDLNQPDRAQFCRFVLFPLVFRWP
ncbi:hypothetical protein CGRA01v4_01013 [Colletotrichum graminicola]|nr:hypothetical protein CGRA01v4_01013 [Colletotrichum graminicola]